MAKSILHQQVAEAVASVFGSHPHQVTICTHGKKPKVTVTYQDYLTPTSLTRALIATGLSVEWDLDRSLSLEKRLQLLDELYEHPEDLNRTAVLRGDVRLYVFDRFASTDFVS